MFCFLLFAGHTDHSEDNLSAPLLSISLGQPAIFLIGGFSLATVPTAVLLRSGDVVMMERESRLAFHAVPFAPPPASDLYLLSTPIVPTGSGAHPLPSVCRMYPLQLRQ